jgi:Arc/MetJ-type ribon-helix-helix transcriptional regulator
MSDQEQKKQEESKDTNEEKTTGKDDCRNAFEEFGDTVGKFAERTVETIKDAFDRSMGLKNTVLTVRITEEANRRLRMLVEAGIFKSRSESAAFLIEEGIKHQQELFAKIDDKMETIRKIKDELKDIMAEQT